MPTASASSPTSDVRWSGASLIAGGISFALFMLIHPYNQLAGAEAARRPTWIVAHSFHFLGAMLALLGLHGLYLQCRDQIGRMGAVGYVGAQVGTAMFVGTGMITAFIWPVIAREDPPFVGVDGAMFVDPLAFGTISATYVVLILGYWVLGIALLRSGALPRAATVVTMLGVLLFGAPVEPVGPVPWIGRVAGAVIFGAGLAWWGSFLLGARAEISPARRLT